MLWNWLQNRIGKGDLARSDASQEIEGADDYLDYRAEDFPAAKLPKAADLGLYWDEVDLRLNQGGVFLIHGNREVVRVEAQDREKDDGPQKYSVELKENGAERGELESHYDSLSGAKDAAERWAVNGGLRPRLEQLDTADFLRRNTKLVVPEIEQYTDAAQGFHEQKLFDQHCDTEAFLHESGDRTINPLVEASQSFYDRLAGTTAMQQTERESADAFALQGRTLDAGREENAMAENAENESASRYSLAQQGRYGDVLNDQSTHIDAEIDSRFPPDHRLKKSPLKAFKDFLSLARIGKLAVEQRNDRSALIHEFEGQLWQEAEDTARFLQDDPSATINDYKDAAVDSFFDRLLAETPDLQESGPQRDARDPGFDLIH